MATLFDRLGRSTPTETAAGQQRRNTKAITRGVQEANARAFLLDALRNGPVPAAIIKELGTARGFNPKSFCAQAANTRRFFQIGQCNTSCSLLAGVSKAKVFRGR